MASRPTYRPGLRLLVVLVAILALYGSMLASGHHKPKEGLDLQGGTTVILTPNPAKGTKVSGGQLDSAVDIIRQRVNGLGVSEADVVRQGNNVVISVPGKGRSDVLHVVGQTAFLTFREIDKSAATNPPPGGKAVPGATPTPAPSSSGSPSPSTSPSTSGTSSPSPSAGSTPTASGQVSPQAVGGAVVAETPPASSGAAASSTPSASTSATPSPGSSATPPAGTPEKDQTAPTAQTLAAFDALDCSKNGGRPPDADIDDDIHHFVVACDRSQGIKYLLKPAQIVGTDVSGVSSGLQTSSQGVTTGAWVVDLTFKDSAVGKVQTITKRLYDNGQQQLAILLDGVVQSAPSTNGELGKNVEISGGQPPFSKSEARNLANTLKYGSLPVPFTPSSVETISATLGSSSLRAGLLAGALGLALVLIYVFLYYRALGLVTVVSLCVSALLVYACVTLLGQLIGFTLTLAGVAGLIIAIGITADSFVVFFERLKDEIHEGRSPRQAVEYGWVRARRTIYSADTVSFLAALILYEVSIGSVKGFAFTLGLSTLLDLFVVILFTKPLMSILIRYRLFSTSKWSGLASIHRGPVDTSGARGGSPATTQEA
ncbi:MAG TPA: protein translocase subunit SecD [Mycobacteriales bacterium]|nr:protein translocase subunit SecD [Mycobacteriales bacterium]